MNSAVWIIIIASLVGVSCAVLGSLLVLRRQAMLGDAISHSVLFGIVLAFLLSGSRSPIIMLVGAGAVGLLSAWLTELLTRHGQLQEDASIGVIFTWLFALGVILISAFAGQVDLDQDCVLHGEIAFAPFDTISLMNGVEIPRTVLTLGGVTLLNIAVTLFFYYRFVLMTFDPLLAGTSGLSPTRWHYFLMTLVSVTVVAAFEAVGAILVIAMLVVPANTGFLFARSLAQMMVIACVVAILSSVGGLYVASLFDGSIAAAIALCAGGCFVVALAIRALVQRHALVPQGAQSAPAPHS